MRFFDVIFAARHLDDPAILGLWKQQEAGSLSYVHDAFDLHRRFRERLQFHVGGDLRVLFGFNIATSIGAMLPSLPPALIATTCEFPAVLSMFRRAGVDLAAWVCPFDKQVDAHALPPDGRVTLLISHVDYITGQDVLADTIEALATDPATSGLRFSVIIDGAHAIGNICAVDAIARLRAQIETQLEIERFVYSFDTNKWLHGLPGLAISIHDGIAAPAIEGVFPAPAGPAFGEFDAPLSVSFNPMLPNWVANLMGPVNNAFDADRLLANRRLAETFRALTATTAFPSIDVFHANTNMALLTTARPADLFAYLESHGYRAHLMGASRVRGSRLGGQGGVRLAFSSHSVGVEDVRELVTKLAGYEEWNSLGPQIASTASSRL